MTKSKILNSFKVFLIFLVFGLFAFAGCDFNPTGEEDKDALFLNGGVYLGIVSGESTGEDISSYLPGWQLMLKQNGYNLNNVEELGFYLETEVPEGLTLNENLTSTYELLLGNKKKKNLVKVYANEDGTKIAFASEKKIQAPQNSEFLFGNVKGFSSNNNYWTNLKTLNLSNFYTDNVVSMYAMFINCESLTSINLKNFSTASVTSTQSMFKNCSSLTNLDLSSFNLENVINLTDMLNFGETSEISELVLPSSWSGNLSVLTKYDLYKQTDNTKLTTGGVSSEISSENAGTTFITGNLITYYIDGTKVEDLTPNHYLETVGATLPTPTRDNYDFSGWFDNENYEGTAISQISNSETGAKTYYAKFTPCVYPITYIINGETNTSLTPSTYSYTIGATLPNVKKDGYTFSGWHTNEELTDNSVTTIPTTSTGEKTFYATLTGNNYGIKFYVEVEAKNYSWTTIEQTYDLTSYTCGVGATLPTPTKTYHNFSGWFDNENREGTAITQISAEEWGEKTYYARWTPETYDITYIIDGEEVKLSPSTYTYTAIEGMSSNITYLASPTKTGYTFVGWYDKSDFDSFDDKIYFMGYHALDATHGTLDQGEKTFYGHWEARTYDVYYYIDGTKTSFTPSVYTYGVGATLPKATKGGYIFSGWYTNSNYTGSVVTSISETDFENKKFYGYYTQTYTTLPTNWRNQINSSQYMSTTKKPKTITKIYFKSSDPTSYSSKIGTLSTGIEVYESTSDSNSIIFYWPLTIYAPVDSSNLFGVSSDSSTYRLASLQSIDFNNFDTSNVTNMSSMFEYSFSSVQNSGVKVSSFDTSNVTNMSSMFKNCNAYITFGSNFDTSKVTDMSYMFYGCKTSLNLSSFSTSSVTDMTSMFESSKAASITFGSNFNTSSVTGMASMFKDCSSLTSLDLSNFNANNVTDMKDMFNGCSKLESITFSSNFNAINVTDMSSMFKNCSVLTSLDLSGFNSSKVTNMIYMFNGCSKLESVTFGDNFDSSNVTHMTYMFQNCYCLENITFGAKFNTCNVTQMNYMFQNCQALLTLDLRNWDTSSVKSRDYMFQDAFFNNTTGATLIISNKFVYKSGGESNVLTKTLLTYSTHGGLRSSVTVTNVDL